MIGFLITTYIQHRATAPRACLEGAPFTGIFGAIFVKQSRGR